MTKPLDAHHAAWLVAHPERDEAWLRRMTADGFDVHHLDGNHENNDPKNLILVEHRDHMMMHSGGRPTGRLAPFGGRPGRKPSGKGRKVLARGQAAYSWRQESLLWREVGEKVGCDASHAHAAAKAWADHRQLSWPPRLVSAAA